MTLPVGITTATVTFGKSIDVLGGEATIVGTVTLDRPVIWAATGDALNTRLAPVESGPGGFLTFPFPHVDQPGFIDAAGNVVTMFAGVLVAKIMYGKVHHSTVTKPFQVLTGQTSVDLDLVPGGSIVPGVTAPTASVLSVNGQTGTVTVEGASDEALAAFVADPESDTSAALSATTASLVADGAADPESQVGGALQSIFRRLQVSQAIARYGIKNVAGNTDFYPFRNAYATWDNSRLNTGAWYALSTQANGVNQSVFRSFDGGVTWAKVGDIPIAAGEYLEHIFVEPNHETILIVKNMNTATNDSYHLLTFNASLVLQAELDLGANRSWHGGMQNVDAVDAAGDFGKRIIMFAEYSNSSATSVRVQRSDDKGLTWTVVLEQTGNAGVSGAGEIRHFHCLQVDPFTKDWWLSSGDTDSQCKIWRSTDEGLTFDLLWSGSQDERQLGFVFEEDAIYYGMDSPGPVVPSRIYKIDRDTMARTVLATLPLGLAVYQVTRTFYPAGFLVWTADEFGTMPSVPVYFYDYHSETLTKVFEFYGQGTAMGIQDASRFQDRESGNILVRAGSTLVRNVYGYGGGTSVLSEVLTARMV